MAKKTQNDRLFGFILAAIGLIVLLNGIIKLDATSAIFGLALTLGGLFEIPEFRLYLKMVISRQSKEGVVEVRQSKVAGSTIVGKAHTVIVRPDVTAERKEHTPSLKQPAKREEASKPHLAVDEDVVLAYDEYQDYSIFLEQTEYISGEIKADGKISVYVLGRSSFKSFEDGKQFFPYWKAEDVKRTRIEYPSGGEEVGDAEYVLVVSNENEDNEEEDDITVSVRLSIEKMDEQEFRNRLERE